MASPPDTPNLNTYPLPENEAERLQALFNTYILDTESEENFNNLAHLAAYICQAPYAMISFLDNERQWFKACYGVEIVEAPRRFAFCNYTILQPDKLMIVPDARQDERFIDNPYVTGEPYIRFYAGVPLVDISGYPLGTICVTDLEPRYLSSEQIQGLYNLARQVMTEIQLHQNIKALDERNLELHHIHEEKNEFMRIVANELRNPITQILGISQTIAEQKAPEKTYVDKAVSIFHHAQKMLRLVNNLLNINAIETNKVHFTLIEVNLLPIAEWMTRRYASYGENKHLNMNFCCDLDEAIVLADESALQQIFDHLLSNAVKYTLENKLIEVRLVKTVTDNIRLEIFNECDDMTVLQQKRIFHKLSGFDEAGHNLPTLGLFIVKKLVTAMQADIWYETQWGGDQVKRGVTFIVQFA